MTNPPEHFTFLKPWRVGTHYGIHVYEVGTDRPIATFFTEQEAWDTVEQHNRTVKTVCSTCHWTVFLHTIDTMKNPTVSPVKVRLPDLEHPEVSIVRDSYPKHSAAKKVKGLTVTQIKRLFDNLARKAIT